MRKAFRLNRSSKNRASKKGGITSTHERRFDKSLRQTIHLPQGPLFVSPRKCVTLLKTVTWPMLHCIQNVTLPNMFHLAKERHFAKNLTALFGEVTRTASKNRLLRNVNSKNKSLRKKVHFENGSLRY